MKILIAVICLANFACTSKPVYKPVPYEVTKIVYCAGEVEVVEYEGFKIKKTDNVQDKVKKLLIERQQRIKVESQLRAELIGCQKPKE